MGMSKEELRRVEVLARVKSGQLRVWDAARLLHVSYRQAKRLWKRYHEEGPAGMKHRSAGQPSHRAYDGKLRQKVLRLVREKYSGAGGALWAEAGVGTFGTRRRDESTRGDAAAVDAGRGLVEPRAKASPTPQETRTQGALWRVSADGRELSCVAGRAWARRLFNRHGGRRDEYHLGAIGGARDDLGGSGWLARVGGELRSAAGVVRGLEESVQASGDAQGTAAGRRADHAVWTHVREVRDRNHRGQFALNALSFGLRKASLRAKPTTNKQHKTKNKKRDISKEVRKGTL